MNKSTLPSLALTGTHGFPGSKLLTWIDQQLQEDGDLAKRYGRIIAIDVQPPIGVLRHTKFYRLDLTDNFADQRLAEIFREENVTTVVHMAFRFRPGLDSSTSHELHSIGTMYLLNACAQQDIEKFVLHSTTYCYGAFPNNPNFLSEAHPLRGGKKASFIRDRVDVERQLREYHQEHPQCVVSVLRSCATLGPTVQNFATRYLSRPVCVTPMGFDPLVQLVHEDDVLQAFHLVIENDYSGVFNIVGNGPIPLLTLLRLSGKVSMPISTSALYLMVEAMWQANLGIVPPGYVDYLRYLWVADGAKAERDLKFRPRHTTRETILAFAEARRLKEMGLQQ